MNIHNPYQHDIFHKDSILEAIYKCLRFDFPSIFRWGDIATEWEAPNAMHYASQFDTIGIEVEPSVLY